MAGELRWILVAICVPLLVGIWWWGSRRSRQAPGNAELREPTLGTPPAPPRGAPVGEPDAERPGSTVDWGVSPLEPLNIRTADFDQVQIADLPMTSHPDAMEETLDLGQYPESQAAEDPVMTAVPPPMNGPASMNAAPSMSAAAPSPTPSQPAAAPRPPHAAADTAATGTNAQMPNISETQRIVTVRVCAIGDALWSGSALMAALENHGLAFGRYQVFHRRHSDGRTLFYAASLVEPGTFDPSRMPLEEFRGLTLFAVLPGPVEPLPTFDALMQTADELAEALNGSVQDSRGVTFSPQRAHALREDIAQFQALLTMT